MSKRAKRAEWDTPASSSWDVPPPTLPSPATQPVEHLPWDNVTREKNITTTLDPQRFKEANVQDDQHRTRTFSVSMIHLVR